ncbi:hypothetical protein K438DRAFT_1976759 [Mycena galopus ATCC 62051]|nr:hypothetical protein K438DRAFT_1976759 [Mycena galopus ATCC 62051]
MPAPGHTTFSGYSVSPDNFTLPTLSDLRSTSDTPTHRLCLRIPCSKCCALIQAAGRTTTNTKLFFPSRWVPAEDSDHDVQRKDSAPEQETEADRAQRDELIALIKQTIGFSVDKSRLQFESVKDVHPSPDPLKMKDDDDDETDAKLFFPARWIPAEDSDHDRNDLIALVKRTSGFSVDTSRLQFESVKDVHPFSDPLKTVCPFVSALLTFCFLP